LEANIVSKAGLLLSHVGCRCLEREYVTWHDGCYTEYVSTP
jgi:hypothetical protein